MLAVVNLKTTQINHNTHFKMPQITRSFSHFNQPSGKTVHFRPRNVPYTQKYYSFLVSHADEQYTWLNEVQKGEAGSSLLGSVYSKWSCNSYTALSSCPVLPVSTVLMPHQILSYCKHICHNSRHEEVRNII